MGAVSVAEAPPPLGRPWVTVPRGRLLLCPGITRSEKRRGEGRARCEEPVVRSAVRGDLRYRVATLLPSVPLPLLYTTHRCHACGTVLELDFQALPVRPLLMPREA